MLKNRKKIKIHNVSLQDSDSKVRVNYSLSSEGEREDILWYQVDKEYKNCLSYELADSVIISLLLFAVEGGYDIESDIPMSETLFYRLTTQLIPYLSSNLHCSEISIKASLSNPQYNAAGVGTGLSLGVDSLTTLYEYGPEFAIDSYKITHLTFFENGAHHGGKDINPLEHELFLNQLEKIREFCDKYGYKLLSVESNINSFLYHFFAGSNLRGFGSTHTFRNCGIVLLFQRLFKVYYYSSAGIKEDVHFDKSDSAHYDRLILPNVSNDNISFYSSGIMLTRLEKIQLLAEYAPSYDHLLVCYKEGENCGVCLKCIRTLVSLDFLNVLEKYTKSFDVEYYYSHRNWYLTRFWMQKNYSPFMKENYEYAKKHNITIPVSCKISGSFYRFCRSFYIKYLSKLNIGFVERRTYNFINKNKN